MTIRASLLAFVFFAVAAPALAGAPDLPDTRDLERIGLTSGWWARAVVDSKQDELEFIRCDEQVVLVQSGGILKTSSGLIGLRLT